MRHSLLGTAVALAVIYAAAAQAQVPPPAGSPAGPSAPPDTTTITAGDHEALRALAGSFADAINRGDFEAVATLLNRPAYITVVSQARLDDAGALKAAHDGLTAGRDRKVSKLTVTPTLDEPAQIYQGTFAIARGSTTQSYELSDARKVIVPTRWTAVAIRDGATWKLLALHDGTDPLDNPALTEMRDSGTATALIMLGVGAVLGLLGGLWLGRGRRRRRRQA